VPARADSDHLDWLPGLVGVAQLVELRVVVPAVASSNLVAHPRSSCRSACLSSGTERIPWTNLWRETLTARGGRVKSPVIRGLMPPGSMVRALPLLPGR
jgi:hypothetical protein